MKFLGLNITRNATLATKANPFPVTENRGGWFRLIHESFTGAWQRNVTVDRNTVLGSPIVFACITLIASDFSKNRVKLVQQDKVGGIWQETESSAFSPVLRKPNHFQTRIQFFESWALSKLSRGNTYIWKVRDQSGVVRQLYILDPDRCKPMITESGQVYYELAADNVPGIKDQILVPASDIIHDRFNCLFHPLVGCSPIYAAGVAATQALNIQENSTLFFGNASRPGGILTAPGEISDETAARLKEYWDSQFSGSGAGKIAVVGDNLTYKSLSMTAVDSQLIEQLKWTSEIICSVFHVPPYKVSVGPMPTYNNIQALNVEYYSQALQSLIEAAELCLDEGLGLDSKKDGKILGTEFDIDNLLRMDSVTQMQVLKESSGILKIDEMRAKLDRPTTEGGDDVYLQEQNYSLSALAKRDANDPFEKVAPPAPAPAPEATPPKTFGVKMKLARKWVAKEAA